MSDIFETIHQYKEILKTCETIYGDRWKQVREDTRKTLTKHHEENKTVNLMSSAIALCKDQDARYQLILLGASI